VEELSGLAEGGKWIEGEAVEMKVVSDGRE
jgi:hypothetical protein